MADSDQTLLILGASGDLAARLLLPGLAGLLASGSEVGRGLALLGSGAEDWDDEHWRKRVSDSFSAAGKSGPELDSVAASTRYLKADVTAEDDLRKLLDACEGRIVIYFALPPSVTERACEALTKIGLPEGSRLV